MKTKILTSVFFIFSVLILNAQLPKGDRILAYQIDMAENNNYDSAFAYAYDACMESVHLFYTWSSIEPNLNNFDTSFMDNTLSVMNLYYPAYNMKVELNIAPINTGTLEVPTDLQSVNFDSQQMIDRFKILLDTLFSRIPNVELTALNIGNESDCYMGTNAIKYAEYKTFLDSIIPYAKQLYFNLHGTNLKVGTTFTFSGLTDSSTSTLCQSVNISTDIVAVTYYPLNNDFTMKNPSVVITDFGNLISIYSDTTKAIYFVECGYASSSYCNSSDTLQAVFFQNIFTAWDTYYDNIKYITIFKTTDWSQITVDELAVYYGLPNDTIFKEYLRTLGVRTYPNNGTNKFAYETILCELQYRNFCTTNCILTEIENFSNQNIITIYPNPTTGMITIDLEKEKIKTIYIYNTLGTQMQQLSNTNTIDITELSKGIYFLKIETKKGSFHVNKMIKE